MAAPTITVTFNDGKTKDIKLNMQDQLQWENTARARHWAVDAEVKSTLFMAWHGLKRTGAYEGNWDNFQTDVEWVEPKDEKETTDESETVDVSFPTKKAK